MAAFGKDEVYLEKLVATPAISRCSSWATAHGNLVHLFERDCTIQRRHQKVIERAPAGLSVKKPRAGMCEAALRIGKATDYVGAGTVEFLVDTDTGEFYFIEVNPRIQVEHTVTEVRSPASTSSRRRSSIAEGSRIGVLDGTGIPPQDDIRLNGHAMQCRITTENPENNFIPDYGRITAYRGAFGFGIRVDGGTAYSGAVVTRYYDPLLEKVTAWAPTAEEVDGAHGSGAARIPHPRRRHQSGLSGSGADPSGFPRRQLHHPLYRRHARPVRSSRNAATARPSC